jgi:hypothetical protein
MEQEEKHSNAERRGSMPVNTDGQGRKNVCAICGTTGVSTGILCYVRRKLVVVPLYQFEPEARYIVTREQFEKELAGNDFKEGTLCAKCYVPNIIRKGNKVD